MYVMSKNLFGYLIIALIRQTIYIVFWGFSFPQDVVWFSWAVSGSLFCVINKLSICLFPALS